MRTTDSTRILVRGRILATSFLSDVLAGLSRIILVIDVYVLTVRYARCVDAITTFYGRDLVVQKVIRWVGMGGNHNEFNMT